jgi:hypothetical protein
MAVSQPGLSQACLKFQPACVPRDRLAVARPSCADQGHSSPPAASLRTLDPCRRPPPPPQTGLKEAEKALATSGVPTDLSAAKPLVETTEQVRRRGIAPPADALRLRPLAHNAAACPPPCQVPLPILHTSLPQVRWSCFLPTGGDHS